MAANGRRQAGAVIVTGASTGIGEACALHLDRLGFEVFAGLRKEADGQALQRKASERLTPLMLDVTYESSIATAMEVVDARVGPAGLAGLVNNAGIAVAAPLEFIPIDALRRQLEVNVIGQIAVTQAALPLLRRGHGRIANIGSIAGRVAGPTLGPYHASKFALDALTASLRMELRPWGLHVALIEPGAIATPIWEKSLAAGDELSKRLLPQALQLYGRLIDGARASAAASGRNGIPPQMVALAVAHALTAERPRTRYVVGRDARLGEVARLLPEGLRERLLTR